MTTEPNDQNLTPLPSDWPALTEKLNELPADPPPVIATGEDIPRDAAATNVSLALMAVTMGVASAHERQYRSAALGCPCDLREELALLFDRFSRQVTMQLLPEAEARGAVDRAESLRLMTAQATIASTWLSEGRCWHCQQQPCRALVDDE